MPNKERQFITFRMRKGLDDDLKEAITNLEDGVLANLIRDGLRLMLGIRTTKRVEVVEIPLSFPELHSNNTGTGNEKVEYTVHQELKREKGERKEISDHIRDLLKKYLFIVRDARGISTIQAARIMDISDVTMRRWEELNPYSKIPKKKIPEILSVLDISAEQLFEIDNLAGIHHDGDDFFREVCSYLRAHERFIAYCENKYKMPTEFFRKWYESNAAKANADQLVWYQFTETAVES